MARVTFIQTEWFEHLGILSLAAYVRSRGHEPSLIVSRSLKRTAARIFSDPPDLVAFSSTTGGHRKALALALALRPFYPGKIIMGGPHPTFFPEVIEHPALDLVCRGEGETALAGLLDRLDRDEDFSELPGLWVKRGDGIVRNPLAELIADLDALPFPDRRLLEEAAPFFKTFSMRRVMAGRGCPHRCAYCFNQALAELVRGKGPYLRLRSVDHVIAELKAVKANGRPTINFVDDTFGLKKSWSLELLERCRAEIQLPLIVNLRPEQVDGELMAALVKAGGYCVQLGIESADPKSRSELLSREMTNEVIEEAARRIKEAGLKLLTYNMVGLPGESLAAAGRTIAWNRELKADFPRISIFQPYPRTELGGRLLKELPDQAGASLDPDLISESYFRSSPLAGPEPRRIENLHKLFWPYLKFPAARGAIEKLTRFPKNPFFDLAFLVSIGVQYRKATNQGWRETIALGLKNLRAYFS